MRIALAGSSLNNRDYLSGSATPMIGLIKELVKNGHQVFWLDRNDDEKITKYSPVPGIKANKGNIKQLPKTLDLDLIIVQTWCFSPEVIAKVFKNYGTKVYYWDDNIPFEMNRLLSAEPYIDKILTHGDGAADILMKNNISKNKIEIFYFASDPTRFKPQKTSGYNTDVVFVGTNLKERNANLKEVFFKPSLILREYGFVLYGSNWKANKSMKKYFIEYKGWVNNQDLNKVYSSAKICINATRKTFSSINLVPSNRIFDVMACGSVLLSDNIPGIEKMFKVGEDLLIANNYKEAISLIKKVLGDQEFRNFIGSNARRKILESHCWKHRVEQLGLNK